jgi:hypothetical protein
MVLFLVLELNAGGRLLNARLLVERRLSRAVSG